jgi:hypothetical protein
MKWVFLSISLLFIAFALVQLNDPDPWVWVVMYGGVAVISFLAFLKKGPSFLALIGFMVGLAWMVTLIPGFIEWIKMGMPSIVSEMKTEAPHIELVREFLGLLLATIALGVVWWKWPKN